MPDGLSSASTSTNAPRILKSAAKQSVTARKKINRMAKNLFESSRNRSAEKIMTQAPTSESNALASTIYLCGKMSGTVRAAAKCTRKSSFDVCRNVKREWRSPPSFWSHVTGRRSEPRKYMDVQETHLSSSSSSFSSEAVIGRQRLRNRASQG